mmetsp:Transcript_28934/g.42849  ORF Transcript_28934/g.42849 Transcript_28934/m.42849 type:complete len:80 (-) Transcript_28934:151-390(-)
MQEGKIIINYFFTCNFLVVDGLQQYYTVMTPTAVVSSRDPSSGPTLSQPSSVIYYSRRIEDDLAVSQCVRLLLSADVLQ